MKINERVYTLIENKMQREKEWNNLTINKNENIELNKNDNVDTKEFEMILKSNKELSTLIKSELFIEDIYG